MTRNYDPFADSALRAFIQARNGESDSELVAAARSRFNVALTANAARQLSQGAISFRRDADGELRLGVLYPR